MYDKKLSTDSIPWTPLDFSGVEMRILHTDTRTGGMTVMTKMAAGAVIPAHSHTHADETVFVISGDFIEDDTRYDSGSFFSGAAGTVHGPHRTDGGCVLLTTFSAALDFVVRA